MLSFAVKNYCSKKICVCYKNNEDLRKLHICNGKARKPQKISWKLGVCPLHPVENHWRNNTIESLCIACLDEGQNPSNSTKIKP